MIEERGRGTTAPVRRMPTSQMPTLTSVPTAEPLPTSESPSPFTEVRLAELREEVDGPDAISTSTPGSVPRVAPVAAEGDAATADGRAAPAGEYPPAVAPSTRHDPLSRFAFPDSPSPIDPAQTLRDWAEGAGLLVGFGIVALWLVRQWLARRDSPGGPTTQLRSVETLNLPQRCRIHLVEVQGRQVLVAMDPAGVKSVTVLPDRFPAILEAETDDTEAAAAHPSEADRGRDWNTLRESRIT